MEEIIMKTNKKSFYVIIFWILLLCAACSGASSISSQEKQKIDELVRNEYTTLVSSGRIRASSYEIDQLKIVGKGSNSREDVEIYCVVILPKDSNQWKPFMVGKLGEYWEAMYPYESEWNGNGCGGLVDYDLDYY
jgi:hypothetical protein